VGLQVELTRLGLTWKLSHQSMNPERFQEMGEPCNVSNSVAFYDLQAIETVGDPTQGVRHLTPCTPSHVIGECAESERSCSNMLLARSRPSTQPGMTAGQQKTSIK
jgi:hypothetical protein